MMEKWMKDDEVQGSVLGGFTGRRAVCVCVCVCLLEAQLLTAGTRNCVLGGDALIFFIVTIVMVSYFFFSCSLICM